MIRWLSIIAIALMLVACADSHQIVRDDNSSIKLSSDDAIFISVPRNGVYGAITYQGSGQNTAQVIYSAFAKHTNSVEIGRSFLNIDEAQVTASKGGHNYLVYPTILHWEDRATEWSARPDVVEIKIQVVDLLTGKTVESAIIQGSSGLATFGGDHPQDLLPESVGEFVSSLY